MMQSSLCWILSLLILVAKLISSSNSLTEQISESEDNISSGIFPLYKRSATEYDGMINDTERSLFQLSFDQLRSVITPEGLLYREIMQNYGKDTRPVMKASSVVNINLTFTFNQVLNIEEKEQALAVILWMNHYWFDEKLIWDPNQFDNITQIKIPSSSIWLPDIVLYNTAEETIKKSTLNTDSRASVSYDGKIHWPSVMRFLSSCNIDLTYFPFDDQICFLKLGSWAYDGFQVDVWNTEQKMDMSIARKNSEFELVDSRVQRHVTIYDCCAEPYPDIKVYLHIRRQAVQHIFNIVIPCIVLSVICMVGFLIPPDRNDEKISVQLTVLFSLSLFMLLVAESTPQTSESVPLISIYLTALMCITGASTTLHLLCDKLVASANIRNELPYILDRVLYKLRKCRKVKEDSEHNLPDLKIESEISHSSKIESSSKNLADRCNGGRSFSEGLKHEESNNSKGINEQTEEGLNGLFLTLKLRQEKLNSDMRETAKWFKVATRMDQVFFWSYGISISILTFYAFVFKPMQKHLVL